MPAILTQLVYLKYRAGEPVVEPPPLSPRYRVRADSFTTHRARVNADGTHRVRVNSDTTHRVKVDA